MASPRPAMTNGIRIQGTSQPVEGAQGAGEASVEAAVKAGQEDKGGGGEGVRPYAPKTGFHHSLVGSARGRLHKFPCPQYLPPTLPPSRSLTLTP